VPVLISSFRGRQTVGDVSYKPISRLALVSARPRAGLRAASELDSVMEFDLPGAILLASSSLPGRRAARELVADQIRAGLRQCSSCLDMSWSQTC